MTLAINAAGCQVQGGFYFTIEIASTSQVRLNGLDAQILDINASTQVRVDDCHIWGRSFITEAVLVENGSEVSFSGGRIGLSSNVGAGLVCDSSLVKVDGTRIADNARHGIHITDSDDCQILGAVFDAAAELDAANTYDCVLIDGASDRNRVQGCKFVPAVTNSNRYAVNVAGSGECNIVVGNDLGDSGDYGTDAIGDTASNTQLFWPADATYGDNFTDCGSGS
jgi:hypothetical protein